MYDQRFVLHNNKSFNEQASDVQKCDNYTRPRGFAYGVEKYNPVTGNVMSVWFPSVNYEENYGSAAIFSHLLNTRVCSGSVPVSEKQAADILFQFSCFEKDGLQHPDIPAVKLLCELVKYHPNSSLVVSFIPPAYKDRGPQDIADAYLRMHLLSTGKVAFGDIKLDNLFTFLPRRARTGKGEATEAEIMAVSKKLTMRAKGIFTTKTKHSPKYTHK